MWLFLRGQVLPAPLSSIKNSESQQYSRDSPHPLCCLLWVLCFSFWKRVQVKMNFLGIPLTSSVFRGLTGHVPRIASPAFTACGPAATRLWALRVLCP